MNELLTFLAAHPILSIILALIIGSTLVEVARAIFAPWVK